MSEQVEMRDKVVSLKLTKKEYAELRKYSAKYGIPPSTMVYLLVKHALNTFDDTRNPDLGFL